MKNLKIVGFVVALAVVSSSSVYGAESKSDSFAKAQLEKMKEFKKHRLSK